MTQRVGAQLHPEPITTAERLAIVRAMTQEFERYLRPGERFKLTCALASDALDLAVTLADPAGEQQLDLELSLAKDGNEEIPADLLLSPLHIPMLLSLARELVHGYFSADRHVRFPPDWSPMDWQAYTVWLRMRQWSPRLEAMADALLAANPEPPDDGDDGEDDGDEGAEA
jgi:hypothetical protein